MDLFVNKKAIVQKIISQLQAEIDSYVKAARAAHAEATHEQSKAEDKYDTRGLEAAYLARGQSKQAADAELAVEDYRKLMVDDFRNGKPVNLGALVTVKGKTETSYYFIGPKAGGTEILHEKQEILVITPQSPLGQQLVGRKEGDKLKIEIGGTKSELKITSVV